MSDVSGLNPPAGETSPRPTPAVPSANEPEPFERPYDGLVVRSAPWGGLMVSVTGARLYRGSRPEDLPRSVSFSPSDVYAVLDVNLVETVGETDYLQRDTWDLILADGSRLRSINPLGVALVGGDRPTVQLYYEARETTDLAGAALELNGAERQSLEPFRFNLDAELPIEPEQKLESLIGQVFAPMAGGALRYEVLDAVYGVNLFELGRRALLNQRLVAMTTRVTYLGNFSESFNTDDAGPRIAVAGTSMPSATGSIETIGSGTSMDFTLIYNIDEAAAEFEMVFDTQDPENIRVPVSVTLFMP